MSFLRRRLLKNLAVFSQDKAGVITAESLCTLKSLTLTLPIENALINHQQVFAATDFQCSSQCNSGYTMNVKSIFQTELCFVVETR